MTALSILTFVFAAIALWRGFVSCRWAVVPAMVASALGFAAARSLPAGTISVFTFIMWECCGLIVLGLSIMLPKGVTTSRNGVGYLVGAGIAGGLLGWAVSQQWIVLGVIIGVLLGALAYVTTPAGKHLKHFSSEFLQYLSAKGLPAVVIVSMALISVVWALAALHPSV